MNRYSPVALLEPSESLSPEARETQRLDRWLWFARFFHSRTAATRLCAGAAVRVNRRKVKPSYGLRVGDVLTFPQGSVIRVVRVLGLASRRGPCPEARLLYEELGVVGAVAG